MNLKFKKLYTTLGVGLLSALSFAPTLNTEAALTAPASWTFKYTNQDFPGYKLRSQTAVITTPNYIRTADGAYYNYTSTFEVIQGLEVSQTFYRSNTTWYSTGTYYVPSDSKIGSDNTVGSVSNKFYLKIDNQTSKEYYLYLDNSSTAPTTLSYLLINGLNVGAWPGFPVYGTNLYSNIFIPSYSYIEFYYSSTNESRYLDSWYLQDLGVSAAYEAGVDDGYIQGQDEADLLVTGFSAMVGILVNFVLMIVNLEVFGVSLMGIFAIVVLFTGIVWTLKLIRG